MTGNRINGFFDLSPKVAPMTPAAYSGFTLNPFGASMPPWQMAVYEAAYLQAQKDLDESGLEFPWAESWN